MVPYDDGIVAHGKFLIHAQYSWVRGLWSTETKIKAVTEDEFYKPTVQNPKFSQKQTIRF